MEKAKVYFTNMRTVAMGDNLLQKLRRLIQAAGNGNSIDFNRKFTATKIHLESREIWLFCGLIMPRWWWIS